MSGGFLVPFSAFYRFNFNAFQEQLQVRPGHFQGLTFGGGQLEGSALQNLIPHHEAGTILDKDLDAVAALIQKNEGVATEQFVVEVIAHQTA